MSDKNIEQLEPQPDDGLLATQLEEAIEGQETYGDQVQEEVEEGELATVHITSSDPPPTLTSMVDDLLMGYSAHEALTELSEQISKRLDIDQDNKVPIVNMIKAAAHMLKRFDGPSF